MRASLIDPYPASVFCLVDVKVDKVFADPEPGDLELHRAIDERVAQSVGITSDINGEAFEM